jgi:hypothetical protein
MQEEKKQLLAQHHRQPEAKKLLTEKEFKVLDCCAPHIRTKISEKN